MGMTYPRPVSPWRPRSMAVHCVSWRHLHGGRSLSDSDALHHLSLASLTYLYAARSKLLPSSATSMSYHYRADVFYNLRKTMW